jgi:hypothetical protein
LNAAHDLAGWIALATSLGLTGLVASKMRRIVVAGSNSAGVSVVRRGAPEGALMWTASLVAMLAVVEAGSRWWFWRGTVPQAATVAQWTVRFPDRSADFRSAPLSDAAREMLRPDFFAAGEWEGEHQRRTSAYYIEWQRGQAAHSIPFLHNPTVCLPMSGCELVGPLGVIAVHWAGGEIPFRAYTFRRSGEDFAVGFAIWDPSHGRSLENDSVGWKGWVTARLQHVVEARADQPAQLLSVALWGEHPENELSKAIGSLIVRR